MAFVDIAASDAIAGVSCIASARERTVVVVTCRIGVAVVRRTALVDVLTISARSCVPSVAVASEGAISV